MGGSGQVNGSGGSSARSRGGIALGVVGIVVHCTLVAFFYLAAGLVAPWYGLVLLFLVWAGLLVLGIRWLRSPVPVRSLAIPFLAAGVWFAVLTLGEVVLGWQA